MSAGVVLASKDQSRKHSDLGDSIIPEDVRVIPISTSH